MVLRSRRAAVLEDAARHEQQSAVRAAMQPAKRSACGFPV
jgi:hypothetical protein